MIKVEDLAKPLDQKTIGEIVAADYRTADVFEKFGIDFCCGGNNTLSEACENKGVIFSDLKNELTNVIEKTPLETLNFNEKEPGELIDYIINVHHKYLNEKSPVLKSYARKVAERHGKSDDSLIAIEVLLKRLLGELNHHMFKEENILFPHIKALDKAVKSGASPGTGVEIPIRMMENEHEHASGILRAIKSISNNYSPPPHACNSHRILLAGIKEMEDDLHRHIHLENNILFPRALALENTSGTFTA